VWVKLVGASYLFYLVARHFSQGGGAEVRQKPRAAVPWLGLTAFWATVFKVELTDIVFAVDSILVGVAMSTKLWVVLTGGILGIIMMRLVIERLLSLVERHPPLVDGAFVIIAWVAIKLVIEFLHEGRYIPFDVPRWLSLGLIVTIFLAAWAYSRRQHRRNTEPIDDARALLDARR
jgi:YkoY family integral membrane protein